MKSYILRFYRKFFSRKGRNFIQKLVYFGLMLWFSSFLIQWFLYSEYILNEWYFFYFIYCLFFYIGIMLLPWTRYTLISKLRIFQIFSFASVFVVGMTIISLHAFLILNQKPATAYPVYKMVVFFITYYF